MLNRKLDLHLLNEMVSYAETSISRRKFILHYFGEEFDSEKGEGSDMDDNMRYPKTKIEAGDQLKTLIKTILIQMRNTSQKKLLIPWWVKNALIFHIELMKNHFLEMVKTTILSFGWHCLDRH